MHLHTVLFGNVNEIAVKERLDEWYYNQLNHKSHVLYLLPSAKWLTTARTSQPGLNFMTFDDVADVILKEFSVEYTTIPAYHRNLFFQDYLLKTHIDEDIREIPYQAKAYADTYGQLKRLGLKINELPQSLKSLSSSFNAYEQDLIQMQCFDSENKIAAAIQMLKQNALTSSFTIVIEGYIDFTPLQYELLIYLVSQNVPITIYIPKLTSSLIEQTTKDLKEIGFIIHEYGAAPELKEKKKTLLKARNTEEEILQVLEFIYEDQQATRTYEHMGIVLANEQYLDELIQLAEQKKIPLKSAKKKSINHSLLIQTLKQLLVEKKDSSKWDVLEEIASIGKLLFLHPSEYTKLKFDYLEKETILSESMVQIHNQFHHYKEQLFFERTVIDHCHSLIAFLKDLSLLPLWKGRIGHNGGNRERDKQISFEWRTYEKLLNFLERWIVDLKHLPTIKMYGSHFLYWMFKNIDGEELYMERTPVDGVGIYTFRDIALFKGSTLYVLGLNEGIYPPAFKLSGYFQPQHLEELTIRYGAPTIEVFEKKAETLFHQLEAIAQNITYSYVIGLDPQEPILPSKYLASLMNQVEEVHSSFHERMQAPYYQDDQELNNKVAYHMGKDYIVNNVPESLVEKQELLKKLASGYNSLSEPLNNVNRSVTAIESYVNCSFKFAMDQVLKIKPVIERVTFVDARKTGILLHHVIEKFYKELGFIGKNFSSCAQELTDEKDLLLLEIFEKEWAELEKELIIDLSPTTVKEEKKAWLKKIKKWWTAEKLLFQNEQLQNMQIYMMEKGLKFTLNNGLEINIKADRVDIDENGFVIYDYKSSNKYIKENEVMDGKVLQLPLYLYALEDILKEKVGKPLRPYGASYINVDSPKTRASNSIWEENENTLGRFNVNTNALKVKLENGAHLEKFNLHTKINDLVEDSKQHFRVNPYGTNSCKYCSYHSVCRVTPDIREGE